MTWVIIAVLLAGVFGSMELACLVLLIGYFVAASFG